MKWFRRCFGRRSTRKGESYLHSERAAVVASDQNVVTSDPIERKRRRRSEVERPRRSRRRDSCEGMKLNINDEIEKEKQTLTPVSYY
ncbi:hypothetical protein KFK09_027155 [Dendrobium nobile]|uniref:Uncharacterized protein n=1 Tax=Dendrobium nobile TaxID=94219 RepID=A0A8T3A9T8_DENNO|nr:hypothetical protein KFK09_027155 [Dendrobium nobile]